MNMDICVVGTSNQLFRRGSYSETKYSKNNLVTGKTPSFMIGSFYNSHSICLKIGFWQGNFVWKYCTFNLSNLNQKTILQFFEKGSRLSEN